MLKKDVTKKMLEQIAEAMNDVMGLEPPIETGRIIKRQDLFDDVLDASLDIQPEDLKDEAFTDDILKWLKVMGWELEADKASGDEDEDEDEGEPKSEFQPEVEVTSTAKRKSAPKTNFKKRPDVTERNELIEKLITKGEYTPKEIRDMVSEKYPDHTISAISTIISDSKNEKYTRFEKVAILSDEGKLCWDA